MRCARAWAGSDRGLHVMSLARVGVFVPWLAPVRHPRAQDPARGWPRRRHWKPLWCRRLVAGEYRLVLLRLFVSPGPSHSLAKKQLGNATKERRRDCRLKWMSRGSQSSDDAADKPLGSALGVDGVRQPHSLHKGPGKCWRRDELQGISEAMIPRLEVNLMLELML